MLDEAFGIGVGPRVMVRHEVKVNDPFTISSLGGGNGYLNDYGGVRDALSELRRRTGGFDLDMTPVACLVYTGKKDAELYCVSMTRRDNPRTYEFLSLDRKAEGVFVLATQRSEQSMSVRQLMDMLDFTEKFVLSTNFGYNKYIKRPSTLPDKLVLGVTYKQGQQKQTWRMVEKIVYTKYKNLDKVARIKNIEKYVDEDLDDLDELLLLVVRDDQQNAGSFIMSDGTDLIKDNPVISWRGRVQIRGW